MKLKILESMYVTKEKWKHEERVKFFIIETRNISSTTYLYTERVNA